MAMTVIKICPKCKSGLGSGVDTRGIGKPFKVCESCGTYVIDKDYNEWELMNGFDKLKYFLVVCWTAIMLGFSFPLVVHLIDNQTEGNISEEYFFLLYLLGVGLVAAWLMYLNKAEITKSKKRMSAPAYRKVLTKLRLLSNE